jgi:3-oxoacyl-[acyl-carrier-protein] synthase-1
MSGQALFPVPIVAMTGSCSLGNGRAAITAALHADRCGLRPNRFRDTETALPTYVGQVDAIDTVELPAALAARDCRNNRLAWFALQQDHFVDLVAEHRDRLGSNRVGVFIGTSTAGILDTETMFREHRTQDLDAMRYQLRHSLGSTSDFVALALGLDGPRHTVSTACSSSAKVFAAAARYLSMGLCDAAIVGGVDTLCYTTLYGFSSLELLSQTAARPFSADRCGISIGEAAAFALLVRGADTDRALLGAGESSDGHHMSSPHPQGLGARRAINEALASSGLTPDRVDYVNLHGTGTPANDEVEARVVADLFESSVNCSSTKGATGHCLGAAGAIEALICDIALASQFVPATVGTSAIDDTLPLRPRLRATQARVDRVISNSFGFGGSNCALVFGRRA